MAIRNISRDTGEELPKYLYEFPTKEMHLDVKITSAKLGLTIKDFITLALIDKLKESDE